MESEIYNENSIYFLQGNDCSRFLEESKLNFHCRSLIPISKAICRQKLEQTVKISTLAMSLLLNFLRFHCRKVRRSILPYDIIVMFGKELLSVLGNIVYDSEGSIMIDQASIGSKLKILSAVVAAKSIDVF